MDREKNYVMYKKGFKYMLDDIEHTKKNLNKFKRGLSIFQDTKMRNQLVNKTAAPVLTDNNLRARLL